MPNYISKVTLPSSGTYEIKDREAREMIASIGNFIVAWDGTSTPVVANIPDGVVVTYNGTTYTGQKTAASAEKKSFYLVKSTTQTGKDVYDEYVVVNTGTEVSPTYAWEKIGDTQFDFGTDVVLGEATTFSGSVDLPSHTKEQHIISATASGTAVGSTTKYLSASASGTAVGANGTANAVTGYPNYSTDDFLTNVGVTYKWLEKTTVPNVTGNTDVTIPNVTNAGSASTWSFTMGTGNDSETLIIGGANGTAPTLGNALTASKVTLGTAKTVATGSVADSSSGAGAKVATNVTGDSTAAAITALGTPSTSSVLTGVKVTSQPSVTLTVNDSSGNGRITYVQALGSVTQPTIALSQTQSSGTPSSGQVSVVGKLTAGTVTEPISITVGNNDRVTVLTPGT